MIIALIVLLFIILILCAPLRAELGFKGKEFWVKVFVWGIPVFKMKPKKGTSASVKKTPEEEVKDVEKKTKSLGERIRTFSDICKTALRLLRKYVGIREVSLDICVGTGDAAITAVSVGALWASVYSLLGIIGSIVYIDEHKVQITPDYVQTTFSAQGRCIIKSRIVYIIIIAITILMKLNLRRNKNG